MKTLLIFPGNSLRNREWLYAAGEYYVEKQWADEMYLHEYDHWQSEEPEIDMEAELEKLAAVVSLHEAGTQYLVFAKSIGSLLTLLAVQRGIIAPEKCVFFGMPLELASEALFKDDWTPLEMFQVPAIAFHNDEDPISYPFTKAALAEHAPEIKLITRQGDNHNYTEFPEFDKEIKALLTP